MSIRTTIETDMALQAGIDLAWLDRIAPDVAVRWRQEHDTQVTGALCALLAARPL